MPNMVEKILRDIENGIIEVKVSDSDCLTYTFSLPNIPFFAEDGITGVCRKYDQSYALTKPII